jgi:hypothetical protein
VDGQRKLLSLLGRGLAVGVASMTLTAAVVVALALLLAWVRGPCQHSELGCMSNLGDVFLVILSAPVTLAVVAPLVARRLRFSWPGCLWFAAPAGWLVLWACVGIPSQRWPFTSVAANVAILLFLYCLAAWLTSRRTG